MPTLEEFASYKEIRPYLESARRAEGQWHPVLAELDLTMFRGARCWAIVEDDVALTVHAARFGKRKKNKWEPYCNWYIAYTHPDYRRQGLAKKLALEVRSMAVDAGCLRLKSLAGTLAGLRLHIAMKDMLWGMKGGEVSVDTPLAYGDWSGVPPNAFSTCRMTLTEARSIKCLRYDKEYV